MMLQCLSYQQFYHDEALNGILYTFTCPPHLRHFHSLSLDLYYMKIEMWNVHKKLRKYYFMVAKMEKRNEKKGKKRKKKPHKINWHEHYGWGRRVEKYVHNYLRLVLFMILGLAIN